MMNNECITFKNYTRESPNGTQILKNVTFSLPKGKLSALIGLSGEGKSTLMESIVGICPPNFKTYGEILTDQNGQMTERDIAAWFENTGYINQTVSEYKTIPLELLLKSIAICFDRDVELVEGLIQRFRLTKCRNTPFANLSGGEKRRAMTIAGILNGKDVNVWDEPLTGLDSDLAHTTISEIRQTGKTNLVSIHQISSEIMKLFDHLVLLHNGTVIYNGAPAELPIYLESCGIEMPEDMFYIDYTIRLCAGRDKNERDVKNIAIFNELTQKIVSVALAPPQATAKSSSPTRSFSFIRVREILYRSLFFNPLFKGSSFITDQLVAILVGTIALTFLGDTAQHLENTTYDKVTAVFNGALSGVPLAKDFLKQLPNILPLITLLKTSFILLLSITTILILPTVLISPDYYNVCKKNIEEKQFSTTEWIVAHFIEIFAKRLLGIACILFIVLRKLGCTGYIRQSSAGIGITIVSILFTGIIATLFSAALLLSPIAVKFQPSVYQLYYMAILITLFLVFGSIELAGNPYNTVYGSIFMVILDKLEGTVWHKITNVALDYIFLPLFTYNPAMILPHLYINWAAYKNYLPHTAPIDIVGYTTNVVAVFETLGTAAPTSVGGSNVSNTASTVAAMFNKSIEATPITIHRMGYINSPYPNPVTIVTLLVTLAKYLALFGIPALLSTVYIYRSIQPKTR
ncbi:hypothetical protein NEDG_00513 [Nematocida displodere]|uniref:ABC transporter domain-containing protein n=1 Tax=Nematocida displodere TaxID=1805483 RepID=A0A177EJI8_9MICR|nr:hypothetical protein NEDG_00513 [Nematocida displodere]